MTTGTGRTGTHRHKAQGDGREYGWSGCVNPDECRDGGVAHGNIVSVEECVCGARRETEHNAGRAVSSGWLR